MSTLLDFNFNMIRFHIVGSNSQCVNVIGKLLQDRIFEQAFKLKVDLKLFLQSGANSCGIERVPTQIKETVVNIDLINI